MSEIYIEKALLKLVRQLNAYDEASLMSLWEKYAERVGCFEPTTRWEESVLMFHFLQSLRLKNQLFNYNWAKSRESEPTTGLDLAGLTAPESSLRKGNHAPLEDAKPPLRRSLEPVRDIPKGKLLQLKPTHEE